MFQKTNKQKKQQQQQQKKHGFKSRKMSLYVPWEGLRKRFAKFF